MLFYKVTGIMEANEAPEEDRRVRRENQRKIEMKSEEFNRNHSNNSFYFISEIDNTVVTAGVIADNKNKVESDLAEFFKYLDLTMKDVAVNEITFSGIENLLGAANCRDYIEDDDDIMERFGLDKITGRRGRGIAFGDNIIEDCTKEKIYESARKYLLNETFIPELDRIYSKKPTSKTYGHPVHYMIQTDDRDTRKDVYKLLLQALYYKMQKLYEEKGVKRDRPAMHMVFTGNPGTAKTTVARLFARIMKENGLLSKGQLIEVGRADLVGKYVGWTAPTVKSKFKAALGGVLFIDEAYSLVEDRDGLYGDEAINTIVQEMENHRDDVVVIFAGYPDKMEGFLQKNPGLRSRIAFHVPFADYSSKELCCIAKLIGKNKGLSFSEDAVVKLETLFDAARQQSDFGNGRYVRNILEQARMSQATRLMEADFDSITTEDVVTIKAEDIAEPKAKPQEKRRIGFVA